MGLPGLPKRYVLGGGDVARANTGADCILCGVDVLRVAEEWRVVAGDAGRDGRLARELPSGPVCVEPVTSRGLMGQKVVTVSAVYFGLLTCRSEITRPPRPPGESVRPTSVSRFFGKSWYELFNLSTLPVVSELPPQAKEGHDPPLQSEVAGEVLSLPSCMILFTLSHNILNLISHCVDTSSKR
mmetsp:Transcript_8220/g.15551  ORF Transcript_8220/g.15551 Transcript_8220/m.15551 type:complete len:184 (+) Transcript_8220:169-720(+)